MNLKTTLHAIKHKSILNLTVFSLKKKKLVTKEKNQTAKSNLNQSIYDGELPAGMQMLTSLFFPMLIVRI